ncbi:hypothetical protein [Paraliomyxa miuraensis]|uniref:hypothetical protein n=1 Tax=Paraliomyxa miuraensis TaxID=376150 RepID=UPI00225B0806|nr:hypothetical protein [Paraliomyxa miuraensis]MCX4242520.1 hypothetical protein [Paraliomyxa miuraensis]
MPAPKSPKTRNPKRSARRSTHAPTPARIIEAARARAFTDESPQAAFDHFRPLAEAVSQDGLLPLNASPLLLRSNVLAALAVVEPHLEQVVEALRDPPLREVFELPALVMALDFAAARVPVARVSGRELDTMLGEGAPWRALMLDFLEVVSHPLIDLVPRERVAAIRAGSGKLDMARDFVAVAGLFDEYASVLASKHPFPGQTFARIRELGTTLVQNIRPGRAAPIRADRAPEAILRDQLAHLVIERYDQLEVLATVALGKRKAHALLPTLRSGSTTSSTRSEPGEVAANEGNEGSEGSDVAGLDEALLVPATA